MGKTSRFFNAFFKSHHLNDPLLTPLLTPPCHHPSSTTHAIVVAHYAAPCQRAAVKIQSYYRGYLARKKLRWLKSLVKVQALVRGHITRKHTAKALRGLQALGRAQAQAHAYLVQLKKEENASKANPHKGIIVLKPTRLL